MGRGKGREGKVCIYIEGASSFLAFVILVFSCEKLSSCLSFC